MLRKTLISLALLSWAFIFMSQIRAQQHPDSAAKSKANPSRVKPKAKTVTTNNAHDRYANQEVSYRKSNGNEGAKSRKKTTNVWGDPHVNECSSAKTVKPNEALTNPKQKPTSQIFMEGGNDSWNTIKAKNPNAAKYDGIDGESNDARRKKPNAAGNTQNLLPYVEQDNVYKNANPKTPNRKRRARTP